MRKTFKSALAAAIVLGSASVALADDYTDQVADGIHAPVAQSQVLTNQSLTTKPVSMQKAPAKAANPFWSEQNFQTSGGGY
jgi:hypothetical protein